MTNNSNHKVVHNTDQQRYEILVDGVLAGFTEATEGDTDVVVFPHTEVFEQFQDLGLAADLVGGALDDVRARGKKVVPDCSYVARYIDRHPDYQDLVA